MSINEAREILGEDYALLSDDSILTLLELVDSASSYVINTEKTIQDNTEYFNNENHDCD